MSLTRLKRMPSQLEEQILNYIIYAWTPRNWMQVSEAFKLNTGETRQVIDFWKRHGIVKEIKGELYSIDQMN